MKKEDLGGITLFCSDIHRFGTDAVLLEYFANNKKFKNACDIGTGCGIIALLLARDSKTASITAVDIQPDAIALVKSAVDENGLADRVAPLCCDVKSLPKQMNGKYDLVVCNPPYKKHGAGLTTGCDGIDIARMEIKCEFSDIAAAAAMLLMPNGRFCVCNRPERLCDVICAMNEYGISPKRLRMISNEAGSYPMLFLCEGVKGAKDGIKILPELYLKENGKDSKEIELIYNNWREHLSRKCEEEQ